MDTMLKEITSVQTGADADKARAGVKPSVKASASAKAPRAGVKMSVGAKAGVSASAKPSAPPESAKTPAIRLERLSVGYTSKKIIDGIDIAFSRGVISGILGANGCGKSTLLSAIIGYLPSSGVINIYDKDLALISSPRERARCVALLPQGGLLGGTARALSVEEFVLLGRLPHLVSRLRGFGSEDYSLRDLMLEDLELGALRQRRIGSLSGGELSRALLARALVQEPSILLLDEPTAALDLAHAIAMMDMIKDLVRQRGLSAISVMHDLNLAAMFCDEIAMIKDGAIAFSGATRDALSRENIYKVYGLKTSVKSIDGHLYILPKR